MFTGRYHISTLHVGISRRDRKGHYCQLLIKLSVVSPASAVLVSMVCRSCKLSWMRPIRSWRHRRQSTMRCAAPQRPLSMLLYD